MTEKQSISSKSGNEPTRQLAEELMKHVDITFHRWGNISCLHLSTSSLFSVVGEGALREKMTSSEMTGEIEEACGVLWRILDRYQTCPYVMMKRLLKDRFYIMIRATKISW